MSTKTSILKRIARVAVIAVLGGTFTSVSVTQSFATAGDVARNVITSISTGSVTSTYKVARVNQEYAVEIRMSTGSTGGASEDGRINVQFTQVPGGTAYSTAVGSGNASSGAISFAAGSNKGTTLFTTGSGATGYTTSTGTSPSYISVDTTGTGETIVGPYQRLSLQHGPSPQMLQASIRFCCGLMMQQVVTREPSIQVKFPPH